MVHIIAMDQLAEGDVIRVSAPSGGGSDGRRRGEPERVAQWPCPRCNSTHTKFCYYNNYNLQQPRHFCKGCRRYWTRGGALRHVPVGGGTSKVSPACVSRLKRTSQSHHAAAPAALVVPFSVSAPAPLPLPLLPPLEPQQYELSFVPAALSAVDCDRRLLDLGGSLLSPPAPMLPNHSHFTTGFPYFGRAGAGTAHAHVPSLPQPVPVVSQVLPEGFWGMGWPDLSI